MTNYISHLHKPLIDTLFIGIALYPDIMLPFIRNFLGLHIGAAVIDW
jgi:hypothetical protein